MVDGLVSVTFSFRDPGSHKTTISMSTVEPIEIRCNLIGMLTNGVGNASFRNGDPKGIPKFGPMYSGKPGGPTTNPK
jgi:hypothetical protein